MGGLVNRPQDQGEGPESLSDQEGTKEDDEESLESGDSRELNEEDASPDGYGTACTMSWQETPWMLERLVTSVNRQRNREDRGVLVKTEMDAGNSKDAYGTLESRKAQRELTKARVRKLGEKGTTRMALLRTRAGRDRKARSVSYVDGEGFKPQPN